MIYKTLEAACEFWWKFFDWGESYLSWAELWVIQMMGAMSTQCMGELLVAVAQPRSECFALKSSLFGVPANLLG